MIITAAAFDWFFHQVGAFQWQYRKRTNDPASCFNVVFSIFLNQLFKQAQSTKVQ